MTAATACDLLESDPDFAAFVGYWWEHKRAPLPLVDYLIEQGLHSQAEAVRWFATTPDTGYASQLRTQGQVPLWYSEQKDWAFMRDSTWVSDRSPHLLPADLFKRNVLYIISRHSPEHCICLAMDCYHPPEVR